VESKLLAGDAPGARRELEALPPAIATPLAAGREDLWFRTRTHPVTVKGSQYAYTAGNGEERSLGLTVSRPAGPFTAIGGAEVVQRFGLTDTRLGLEVYAKGGERSGRWGYLSLAIAPGADFLPRFSLGGEIYQKYREMEFSAGYTRMEFRDDEADIFRAGATLFLPRGVSVSEKAYYAPSTGGYTFDTSANWERDHRFKAYLGVGAGKGAERIGSALDLRKVPTTTWRLGAEFRWSPAWSAGTELLYEHRSDLYDRHGLSLFVRYWP
jgi:YaiO family outer membrane protein